MSGVAVIIYQLTHNTALNAVVAASHIYPGEMPLKTSLPAIAVTQVSSVPRNIVAGPSSFNTDRVQVTVVAKTYPQLRNVMRLIKAACPMVKGTVNGIKVDSVLPDIAGPDIPDPDLGGIGSSRDFIVTWNE